VTWDQRRKKTRYKEKWRTDWGTRQRGLERTKGKGRSESWWIPGGRLKWKLIITSYIIFLIEIGANIAYEAKARIWITGEQWKRRRA